MSLVIHDLHVSLGGKAILKGLDLEIPKGSLFALLGPSGCGKSTLLKTIAGLLEKEQGEILWGGQRIDELPPEKRGILLIFQDLRLFPQLSVLDNVVFPLKMRGMKRKERCAKARAMLEKVHLTEFEKRLPHKLSGGQQQRLALARALVTEPCALLLDEPFSSLDPPLRLEMQELLLSLQRELGTTMLLVSHDPEEVRKLAQASARMENGRIVLEGQGPGLLKEGAQANRREDVRPASSEAFAGAAGVRFLLSEADFAAASADEAEPAPYCRWVEQAAEGRHLKFRWNDLSCPSGRAALMAAAPGSVGMELAPWRKLPEAEIVLLVARPASLMRLIQRRTERKGQPLTVELCGSRALCHEMTAAIKEGREANLSLLCDGSRAHTSWGEHDLGLALRGDLAQDLFNLSAQEF